jgi:hypothetical protein
VLSGGGIDGIDIVLDPTEGVTLEVRTASGAVPDEVRLAVLDPSGAAIVGGAYATGEGGRIRVESVPPGSWDLAVSASATATTRATVQAPGGPTQVILPPSTSIRVEVPELRDVDTTATASLRDEAGRSFIALGWSANPRSTWRLANGQVHISSLPPGQWTVTVRAGDERSWSGSVTTTAGGETAVLRLE